MILFNMCQKLSLKCVIVILLSLVLHAVKVTVILKVYFRKNCYYLISSISSRSYSSIERMQVISENSFKIFLHVINKGRISIQFYNKFYRFNKKNDCKTHGFTRHGFHVRTFTLT